VSARVCGTAARCAVGAAVCDEGVAGSAARYRVSGEASKVARPCSPPQRPISARFGKVFVRMCGGSSVKFDE
jgi:hypothetical protein